MAFLLVVPLVTYVTKELVDALEPAFIKVAEVYNNVIDAPSNFYNNIKTKYDNKKVSKHRYTIDNLKKKYNIND